MLIELQVENFRSFRDRQRFTMVASADNALEENTIAVPALGKQRLLRSAVVYGPNAAGKSNLIKALAFIEDFVTRSDSRRAGDPIPFQPFRLNATNRAAPSLFEITFIKDGVRYQYGFKIDRQRVHEEWLLAYPKRTAQQWFRRTQAATDAKIDWYFGPNLRGDKERLANLTKPDALFLTSAVQFSQPQLQTVYDWFARDIRIIESTPLESEYLLEEFNAELMRADPLLKGAFRDILRVADLGITDVDIRRESFTEDDLPPHASEETRKRILASAYHVTRLRHSTEEDPDQGLLFPMVDESLGTVRLYRLIGQLLVALGSGCLFAVDELDASLHPDIVRWIASLFRTNNRLSTTAQLLFNTHDTTLLDAGIFRRDQIWFVEKDRAGASHLYSLLDYSPRKNEALGKGYMQGRYGAIPFIGGDWVDIAAGGAALAATVGHDHAEP